MEKEKCFDRGRKAKSIIWGGVTLGHTFLGQWVKYRLGSETFDLKKYDALPL